MALFGFLPAHGYVAAVINPIQTDAFRDVWTVNRVKTDAAIISDFVRYKRFASSALGDEAIEELRNLARYRMLLVERFTMLKNRATAILDRMFPELAGLFSGSYSATHRALLEHSVTPDQMLSTDVRMLAKILEEASCGRCGRAKAEQLKAFAKQSVGVSFGSSSRSSSLWRSSALSRIGSKRLKRVPAGRDQREMVAHHPGNRRRPRVDHRRGDRGPRCLRQPHKLMAYAGMDPTKSESGETVKSDGRMSKRGPSALRWAFVHAADCARKFDPCFGDYYDRKKGEDIKHHYVALSGVARKLMGVVLAVMKEKRPASRLLPATTDPATRRRRAVFCALRGTRTDAMRKTIP